MARYPIPSDTFLKAIKPGDLRKRISDGDGLDLLLFVKPGEHGWRFDDRFAGRRNMLSFGSYPDTTLAIARRKADAARRLLAEGFDPSQQRKDGWARSYGDKLTGNGPLVFRGERHHDRPMSDNTVNAALRAMGFSTDEVTGHGFRATARTMLHERLGFDPHAIEAQLAHSVQDALSRAYNRTEFLEQRRKMMQASADYLDKLRKAPTDSAGAKR
jgi:integrase